MRRILSVGFGALFTIASTSAFSAPKAKAKPAPPAPAAPAATPVPQAAPATAAPAAAEPAAATTAEVRSGAGESEIARSSKKFNVALRYGNAFGGFMGGGIQGNYFISPNWQVGAIYEGAGDDAKDDLESESSASSVAVDKAEFDINMIGVQTRYYFGNSFNIIGGLVNRVATAGIRMHDKLNSANFVEMETESTALCILAGIGNTWSWESGFFIGGDWIGATIPIASSSKSSVKTGGTQTAALADMQRISEDFAEDMSKMVMGQLLMLNIGWAF